ncbi:glycosyltransferase [Actinotalea sp. K2]|uniref:glycosyltransferase n=1 Tax=Actinotalea sp. K2 TaxID=2939438 RepID=UPI002016D7FC|nr:glycosyltransferase [Actinotalea sp. K2]MCL3861291.1 glycosyltransferase [Actinotalea sp. K2]
MTTRTHHGGGTGRTILLAHPSADLYGSDRVALESVSALVEAGWRVIVTLPAHGPLSALVRERGAHVAICPTLVLRKALLRPRGVVTLLRDTLAGLRHGWRLLVHLRPAAMYVNTVTIPLWVLLARLRRVPTLCHVHEAEGSAPAWARTVLGLPLLAADVVIANSRFSIGVIARSFPRLGRRIELVHNGVPGPADRSMGREVLEPPVRIVYIGRLSPRKGVDVAVDALRCLDERGVTAHLDLVGAVFPGYEWYQAELEAQVARLDLRDRVTFHGFRNEVWDLVRSSDLVVVPSRIDEPFGNTAVEAVLCARPVVASETSGLLEATAGYRSAHTVLPGSAEALADGIVRVVSEWDRSRNDAWADAATAVARHSPQTFRARVVDVVSRMVT